MSKAPAEQVREIPLDQIAEPSLPMRETFDEARLASLAESMRRIGLVQPITLRGADGRYEIVDGHRRYIAARGLGWRTIQCVVKPAAATLGEAMKVAANVEREDPNPAEEAVYLEALLRDHCGGDVDALVALVQRRREYIEERLLLGRGDPDVLAAVRARKISLAVARELNATRNVGDRRAFLEWSIAAGAPSKMVREWRQKAEMLLPAETPAATAGGAPAETPAPTASSLACICCGGTDNPWEIELLPVHRGCHRLLLAGHIERVKALLAEQAAGG